MVRLSPTLTASGLAVRDVAARFAGNVAAASGRGSVHGSLQMRLLL